jgi:hypothetical protein
MRASQIIINGKIDIHTTIFESNNSERIVVVKFNPTTKDTKFIFSDFKTLLEREIECNRDSFSDSNWKTFEGNRIPENFLIPLVTTQTKLLDPVINWIDGFEDDIILF